MSSNLRIGYPSGTVGAETSTPPLAGSEDFYASGAKAKVSTAGTSVTGQTDVNLYAGTTAVTPDHFALFRAKLLQKNSVTSVSVRQSSVSFRYPETLEPTMYLDATRGITADSNNRVSSWYDRDEVIEFTQSTAARKPLWTRADSKENLIVYSEDLSQTTYWNATSYPVTITSNSTTAPDGASTADTVTASGGAAVHGVRVSGTGLVTAVPAGLSYTMSVYVKRSNHDYLWIGDDADSIQRGVCVNINAGTIFYTAGVTSSSITSIGSGWYRVSIVATKATTSGVGVGVWLSNSSNNAAPPSFTAGGEAVYAWGFQAQMTPSADTTYLATGADIQVAGVNGQRALFFDGTDDNMTSTTLASDLFTNNAKTCYIVWQGFNASQSQIFADSNNYMRWFDRGTALRYQNNDGSNDFIDAGTLTAGNVYYVETRHDSGTIYGTTDGVTTSSTASGNTTALNGTMVMGWETAGTFVFRGKICAIITFDEVLSGSQRTNMRAFLEAAWKATPIYQNHTWSTQSFSGPASDDFVTTSLTGASSNNYFRVSFDTGRTTSTRPFSKIYLGAFFDFGRDPIYGRRVEMKFSGEKTTRPMYRYSFTWEGVTDAKRESFESTLGKYIGCETVFLHADTFSYILNGYSPVYCRIVSYDPTPTVVNSNTITVDFEEVL